MMARFLQQNAKKFLSGLLAVWLSGLVFLFCCEMPKTQAAENESCPLAKASHCNKKSFDENPSEAASFQKEHLALDCCRLMPSIFDKARKVEKNPQTSKIASTVKISSLVFVQPKAEFSAPSIFRSLPLNRGGAYLKNRVFRI